MTVEWLDVQIAAPAVYTLPGHTVLATAGVTRAVDRNLADQLCPGPDEALRLRHAVEEEVGGR